MRKLEEIEADMKNHVQRAVVRIDQASLAAYGNTDVGKDLRKTLTFVERQMREVASQVGHRNGVPMHNVLGVMYAYLTHKHSTAHDTHGVETDDVLLRLKQYSEGQAFGEAIIGAFNVSREEDAAAGRPTPEQLEVERQAAVKAEDNDDPIAALAKVLGIDLGKCDDPNCELHNGKAKQQVTVQ